MIIPKLLKFFITGLILMSSYIGTSQMSYEEFHQRYTPTNEKIVPNADVVKSVNDMTVSKAANQIKNTVNSAYDGDDDDELLVVAVLTSCNRSHIAKILAEMDPYDAVRALNLLKSSWVKEIVYFVDIQTYHEIAPDLFLKLFMLNPRGPFGPMVKKWTPAYAGVFYDMSYSGMKGYNNVIDSYGDGQTVTGLKGFGLAAGIYTGYKEGKNRFIDITYQNRTGKTKYETTAFFNSKVQSNTLAINFLKGSDGPKFMWAHGWGIQANMVSYKFQDFAGKYNRLGGGINGGLNYNLQFFINPIKSIPVMLGVKAYAQVNIPGIDFNKLSDTLLNTNNAQFDDYKSSIATYGIQIQALYKFGKEYVKPEYKDYDTELSETYDKHLNTAYSELTPRISADGKTLYFVRENHPLNHGKATNSQDIWIADVSNGIDNATALHLEKPFNQNNYNSIIGISPDGTSMMIKGRYDSDGKYLGLGFSMLQKTTKGWSKPKALDVNNYVDMAKGTYVGAHWSTDGKHIVISLSEDDEDDNQDIYVSHLQEDGSWSKPKSVGSTINTDGDDNGPFLASDGKTLYFSSDREGGEGSNDIWMSQRQDDSWTKWSEPINLGPEINSAEWEAYYTIDAQGKYAYMLTYQNSKGGSDITRIKLKEEVQPDPVVLVSGVVLDKKTNKPVSASISYNGIDDGKNYGVANSDPETGKYTIVLPYGVNYEFTASASNYIGISDNLDLTTVGEYKVIEKDLYLVPIEVGATVRLNNIFFEIGKSDLKSSSFAELDRVVKFLNDNPNVTIEISGHTDNVGNKSLNQSLSQQRAQSVTEYLISKGVDKARLTTKGYGMEKPVADNSTEKGRTLNRRVEFTILTNE